MMKRYPNVPETLNEITKFVYRETNEKIRITDYIVANGNVMFRAYTYWYPTWYVKLEDLYRYKAHLYHNYDAISFIQYWWINVYYFSTWKYKLINDKWIQNVFKLNQQEEL